MQVSKRVVVEPRLEAEAIDTFAAFGWKMISRNEIYNAHEAFDGAEGWSYMGATSIKVYTHTEVASYVSLLLQTDDDDPNYSRLCQLLKEFQDNIDKAKIAREHYDDAIKDIHGIGGYLALVIIGAVIVEAGFTLLSVGISLYQGGMIAGGAVLLVFGAIMAFGFLAFGKKVRHEKFDAAYATQARIKEQIEEYSKNADKALTEGRAIPKQIKEPVVEIPHESVPPKQTTEEGNGSLAKLREAKQMLDEGLISQEEYDAMKKKIIG